MPPQKRSPDNSNQRRDRSQLGPIRPGELYPLPVLKQRLGWGDAALRRARQDGLFVKRYGNLYCVMGRDVIEFLESRS